MATPPDNHQAPLKYQTWTLKVPIHCEGCKKKVRKILQSIDGVYMTTIDSQQQKVIVTGNVEAETLLKKLSKSGKPAQLWPDYKPKEVINEPPPNIEENKDKPNDEQVNKNPEKNPINQPPPPTEGGNNQDGQRKKKKKKNKGQNNNSTTDTDNIPSGEAPPPPEQPQPTPPPESTPPPPEQPQPTPPPESTTPQQLPPSEQVVPPLPAPLPPQQEPTPAGPQLGHEKIPIESLNLGPPSEPSPLPMHHHPPGHHPYFRPPVNNPGYIHMPPLPMGVSYSMAQRSTSGSYYVPPTYPYNCYPHHPMMHSSPLPPPPCRISDYYDDHDQYNTRDYNDDTSSQCRLM